MLLGFHQTHDRVLALRSELARVAVIEVEDVARELDDRDLHPETDPEERQSRLAGCANRFNHALDATHAEPAGYQQPVIGTEDLASAIVAREQVAREPRDIDTDVVA